MEKMDYKKAYKELYVPKKKPAFIEVPKMVFIQVKGRGNPNTSESYAKALEILFGLSYSIKMSKNGAEQPEGYFDFVVPPLEGLWWVEDEAFDWRNITDKEKFCWYSMIRQPEFVTPEVFAWAKGILLKKKPEIDYSDTKLVTYEEGLCCQIMHQGSYDDEPVTIEIMEKFITESGYVTDYESGRYHHEIYLNDFRKTATEKLKTVIRHPVKKAEMK